MGIEIQDLRMLCNDDAVRWTDHILKRLMQRGITQDDVLQAIRTGEIIDQYPDDYPFPSCLILGLSVDGKSLHVVCGLGLDEIYMITAYYPNPGEWDNEFRKKVAK